MKGIIIKAAVTVALLLLISGISFAVDQKNTVKPAAETPAKSGSIPKKDFVDINNASVAELKNVDGIGEAFAAKIINGRPYAKKDQLKSRNILPGPVYEKVKDRIIAKQPKKEEKKDIKPELKKK